MQNPKDTLLDPSKRAEKQLTSMLEGDIEVSDEDIFVDEKLVQRQQEKAKTRAQETDSLQESIDEAETNPEEHAITTTEALHEEKVLRTMDGREKARLLYITKDTSILHEGSELYRKITDMSSMFLEIHIILLNIASGQEKESVTRLSLNAWVYGTYSKSWNRLCFDAYRIANSQLMFSGGFRADIIIADNLFETGIVGQFLSDKHERPLQIHVTEDFFDEMFVNTLDHPVLYKWSVWYLLGRVQSFRTKTEFQRQAIVERYHDLEKTTELLPSYYNLDIWRDCKPTKDLHTQYPRFKFIILHVSSMHPSSHTMEAIMGSAKMLRRYPTVGLVVVGNGPQRVQLEKQVIALGLEKQVEFLPMSSDVISYMKTANIYIHLSEDSNEDALLLQAAVSKIPLIVSRLGIGEKLFIDEESAYLCLPTDIACIANSINRYLNENQTRTRYTLAAFETVFEQIEQDYQTYLHAFVESIERSLTVPS